MSTEGTPTAPDGGFEIPGDARYAIVASRFNGFVVDRLLEGALAGLTRHGVGADRCEVVRVPGAWEIPLLCMRLCATGRFEAVIALGAVIRGDTPHFDYVAGEAARGCMRAMLDTDTPVIFGILTTDDREQALARAQDPATGDNKGVDAALAALELTTLGRT